MMLAELVAGKSVDCRLRRFGNDDRNWGICRLAGSGGNRLEDTINGQLLLSGWVLPHPEHGREFLALAGDGEVVGHLLDTERIFTYRLLRIGRFSPPRFA